MLFFGKIILSVVVGSESKKRFGILPKKQFCRAKYGKGYSFPILATKLIVAENKERTETDFDSFVAVIRKYVELYRRTGTGRGQANYCIAEKKRNSIVFSTMPLRKLNYFLMCVSFMSKPCFCKRQFFSKNPNFARKYRKSTCQTLNNMLHLQQQIQDCTKKHNSAILVQNVTQIAFFVSICTFMYINDFALKTPYYSQIGGLKNEENQEVFITFIGGYDANFGFTDCCVCTGR